MVAQRNANPLPELDKTTNISGGGEKFFSVIWSFLLFDFDFLDSRGEGSAADGEEARARSEEEDEEELLFVCPIGSGPQGSRMK